jgi:hypothetical protein
MISRDLSRAIHRVARKLDKSAREAPQTDLGITSAFPHRCDIKLAELRRTEWMTAWSMSDHFWAIPRRLQNPKAYAGHVHGR